MKRERRKKEEGRKKFSNKGKSRGKREQQK